MDLNYTKPISVEEAIRRVLQETKPLATEELTLTSKLLGHVLAENLVAKEPFPNFPASIMDGYAVKAPLEPGTYQVVENVFAGDNPNFELTSSQQISYITTGSQVPNGANAVVKVEDTEKLSNGQVKINVSVKVGTHIREIGSDIQQGELVLKAGDRLGPTELGLLATTGFTKVRCFRKPIVGVMSTGNELVEPWETTSGSHIRDSNRISLISAFQEEYYGYDIRDYGIMKDSKEEMTNSFLRIVQECDVIVTSGGVSMGAADFIKPILSEMNGSKIHFNKLNMKPGKPTTFATISTGNNRQVLFFGLPGNPVSCLVTKSLFIDPALKRLQGASSERCLQPQLRVRLGGSEKITLDPERVEYHRVYIKHSSNDKDVVYIAESTGNQRSSRLLSMRSANGLLVLPQGPGVVEPGTILTALLVRPLEAPPAAISVHSSASLLDTGASSSSNNNNNEKSTNNNNTGATPVAFKQLPPLKEGETEWRIIKVGLLTISDRVTNAFLFPFVSLFFNCFDSFFSVIGF
jgi:gephyrin